MSETYVVIVRSIDEDDDEVLRAFGPYDRNEALHVARAVDDEIEVEVVPLRGWTGAL